MGREEEAALVVEVGRVRGRIDEWRATRRSGSPMPAELWDAAASLAREHGVYPVSRSLHVDYGSPTQAHREGGGGGWREL